MMKRVLLTLGIVAVAVVSGFVAAQDASQLPRVVPGEDEALGPYSIDWYPVSDDVYTVGDACYNFHLWMQLQPQYMTEVILDELIKSASGQHIIMSVVDSFNRQTNLGAQMLAHDRAIPATDAAGMRRCRNEYAARWRYPTNIIDATEAETVIWLRPTPTPPVDGPMYPPPEYRSSVIQEAGPATLEAIQDVAEEARK